MNFKRLLNHMAPKRRVGIKKRESVQTSIYERKQDEEGNNIQRPDAGSRG